MKTHNGEYPAPIVPVPGYMLGLELEWLYQQAKKHRVIVEVGSACGKSSHALLTGNFKSFGSSGKVYCVDLWAAHKKGTEDEFDYGRKDLNRRSYFLQTVGLFPNLHIWEMDSYRAYWSLKSMEYPEVDMVFLDGGTSNMASDIANWRQLPCKLFCGHDYSDKYPGVVAAVNSYLPDRSIISSGSIWYVER